MHKKDVSVNQLRPTHCHSRIAIHVLPWSSFAMARALICFILLFAAPARSASLFAVTGIWSGQYDCAQGKTALQLDVSVIDPMHLQALFYFHATAANPQVPDGCFLMQGQFDNTTNSLSFAPTKWLLRPPGYVWVALDGELAADGALSGTITGPGCSDFSLNRAALATNLPRPCKSPGMIGVS